MTYLTSSAHDVIARQHGMISVEQLLESGLTQNQIKHLEANGAIRSIVRNVYRSPSVPLTELGRCAAVCLGRPSVVIAGPTAARLWGFRRVRDDRRIHVVAPPASNPSIEPWVVPYRTAAIHVSDVIVRDDGIRVTTPARTAYDLSRHLRGDDLLSVIEQAMHIADLGPSDMFGVASDWSPKRRPWIFRYLTQLEQRIVGGAAESHAEVRVALALRRKGLGGLRLQHELVLPDYGHARFDIAVPHLEWDIEVDAHPSHEESAGRDRDRRRDLAARQVGWIVSRISRDRYDLAFDDVIDELVAFHRSLIDERAAARAPVGSPDMGVDHHR